METSGGSRRKQSSWVVGDGKVGEWGIKEVGCEWPGTEPGHQRGFGVRSGARVSPCGHWSLGTL